jgi:hypothetical protein
MYLINVVMDLPFVSFQRVFPEDAMILQCGHSLGDVMLNKVTEMVFFQICIQQFFLDVLLATDEFDSWS